MSIGIICSATLAFLLATCLAVYMCIYNLYNVYMYIFLYICVCIDVYNITRLDSFDVSVTVVVVVVFCCSSFGCISQFFRCLLSEGLGSIYL